MSKRQGFDRRKFLQAISVSAGTIAAAQITGCGSSSPDNLSIVPGPEIPPPRIVDGFSFYPQSVASGDPRSSSVILWTRVDDGSGDLAVRLQVARDEMFDDLVIDAEFTAPAAHDHCLKVRATNLETDSNYFYRFLFLARGDFQSSPIGRAKTAPAADAERDIRFGFVSCQDPSGRYYNTLHALLAQDLDFVLHLGDYIYETTGDESFQGGAEERAVFFSNPDEALRIGDENGFLAARSVGNYRDLYRNIKADPLMRQLHERFPMIAIWDDHEFSDDQWGGNGTYLDAREDELDEARKRNAEQVYFEYMPIDPAVGDNTEAFFDDDNRFPDTRIYRDFQFGRNLDLLCTDYRTYRPDHLIPEDAFPAAVPVDQAELTQVLAGQGVDIGDVIGRFTPYVAIDDPAFAPLKPALLAAVTQAYLGEGLDDAEASARASAAVAGNLAIAGVNTFLEQFNAAVPTEQQAPLIDDSTAAAAPRGIAYLTLGKLSLFGDLGSRYLVVEGAYDAFAAARAVLEGSQTQDAYGQEQDIWLRSTLMNSTARWKVVANSVSNTSIVLDLTSPLIGAPPPFNQRFYLNVDQWDGFPNQRAEYLQNVYGPAGNVVLLAGDIHASFAAEHDGGTVEFTTSSISSSTFFSILVGQAAGAGLGGLAGDVAPLIDQLLRFGVRGIRHLQTQRNGVSIVDVGADAMVVSYFELTEDNVFVDRYDDPSGVLEDMTRLAFRVEHGSGSIEVLDG